MRTLQILIAIILAGLSASGFYCSVLLNRIQQSERNYAEGRFEQAVDRSGISSTSTARGGYVVIYRYRLRPSK